MMKILCLCWLLYRFAFGDLLPIASKVCEKIVLSQFNTYLIDNNRLTSHQRGNKNAHSTETLNIHLTDSILEAMDKKQITALVLLDLSKAFDSIDHTRLLHKLSIVGASPSTVNWFKSSNMWKLILPTRTLFQSPMAFPKERSCHRCFSVFTWTICPQHLALASWSNLLMIQSYSCLFRWWNWMLPLKS